MLPSLFGVIIRPFYLLYTWITTLSTSWREPLSATQAWSAARSCLHLGDVSVWAETSCTSTETRLLISFESPSTALTHAPCVTGTHTAHARTERAPCVLAPVVPLKIRIQGQWFIKLLLSRKCQGKGTLLCTDANCSLSHGAIEALHPVGPLQSSPPLSAELPKHGKNLKKPKKKPLYLFFHLYVWTLSQFDVYSCAIFTLLNALWRVSLSVVLKRSFDFVSETLFVSFKIHDINQFFLNDIKPKLRLFQNWNPSTTHINCFSFFFFLKFLAIKAIDLDVFINKPKSTVFLTQPLVFSAALEPHSILHFWASFVYPPPRVHSLL